MQVVWLDRIGEKAAPDETGDKFPSGYGRTRAPVFCHKFFGKQGHLDVALFNGSLVANLTQFEAQFVTAQCPDNNLMSSRFARRVHRSSLRTLDLSAMTMFCVRWQLRRDGGPPNNSMVSARSSAR